MNIHVMHKWETYACDAWLRNICMWCIHDSIRMRYMYKYESKGNDRDAYWCNKNIKGYHNDERIWKYVIAYVCL